MSQMNSQMQSQGGTEGTRASRGGGVLVLVLVVMTLVMGLAMGVGALVMSRTRLVQDEVLRTQLRLEAISAVARVAWEIDADTNGVDSVLEPWASPRQLGDVRVSVEDESGRLCFQADANRSLGYLLVKTCGLREEDAMGQARRLSAWWKEIQSVQTNAVLRVEEELLESGVDAELLRPVLPYLTVWGEGRVNINTVSHEVFVALALESGAAIGPAETLFARVERSRRRGEVFATLGLSEVDKLLMGHGDSLTSAEQSALKGIVPRLGVEGRFFRITAEAQRSGVRRTVQSIYERGTGRLLRWVEW